MKGYWNLPDATAGSITADGWLNTGDIGRVDSGGYFYIVDRTKDMIIRGGYNVYPREIEEVLYEHPAVAEAAVVAIPHDSLGEVGAAVALKEGAAVAPEELRDYVKARVPTNTRDWCGSSTRCPKDRPGRSRNATSPSPQPKVHDDHGNQDRGR
ncbi:hypothetical protein MSEO_00150 [Mycobacterium seoulense]|uniref:AMP-binding enzyme C-terminal domain-containing protein n=2 Tax=Mycobacterium seoulense TaxID=386911 RepID=A0A7I7NS62_9MYCO|nr:hypothetical protein MSEO_00150 [Mycobacterium seoulense]